MGLYKLRRDGQPQPRTALPRHALKRLKQAFACLLGNAGPRIGDLDRHNRPVPPGRHADRSQTAGLAFERLNSVAAEIRENPVEVIAVGVDLDPTLEIHLPTDRPFARETESVTDLRHKRRQGEAHPVGRRLLGLAEVQGLDTEANGAVEGCDQLRNQALHGRVPHLGQTVGKKLRARQHVA